MKRARLLTAGSEREWARPLVVADPTDIILYDGRQNYGSGGFPWPEREQGHHASFEVGDKATEGVGGNALDALADAAADAASPAAAPAACGPAASPAAADCICKVVGPTHVPRRVPRAI